jgi:D-alanyl-D-alanine carboxypeptidase
VLSLDDTIGQRLPYLPAAWANVTLREALNHTSGLPSFTDSHKYLAALQASPAHGPSPRQLVAFVEKDPLLFRPGTRYRYSNTDNVIAGLMVEQATGRSYEYELQRRVLRPLHLRRTTLPRTVAMPRPLLHGYQFTHSGRREDISTEISPAWTWAAGGIVSTPAELNRFARAYASGRLFSRAVHRAQLLTVRGNSEPPGPGVNSSGLGIFRYRTRCGTVYGHTGNFPGYTQFFAATLDGRRSVTVSVNLQLRPDVQPRVFNLLLRADTLGVCAALAR